MDFLERKRKPKEAELKENPSEAVVPAEEGAGGKENEAGPNSARTQNPPPPDAENEEEEGNDGPVESKLEFKRSGFIHDFERKYFEEHEMYLLVTAEGETSAARTQVNLTVSDSEKTLLQQLDGLYLTNADFEVNSDSVRRFEQRCIQSGEDSYFRRDNKELKLDNKLFDTKIYKKVDISLSRNSFLGLKRRNAVICERLNQKKNKYYLIEMFVGKLSLEDHELFSEEDRLSSKMKMRMREYNEKVDKCLLPHLGEVMQVLSVEANRMSGDENVSESDMALLQTQIKEVGEQIQAEKKAMGECMSDIYDSWKAIKALRKSNGYQATAIDLGVQEYTSELNLAEQHLVFKKVILDDNTDNLRKRIPGQELSRREKIKGSMYFLKIYINNELMTVSEKKYLSWPSYEIEFMELFQVFIYTKPYSITIEVCTGSILTEVLDRIHVDVPGEAANSLTSASYIQRSLDYKKEIVYNPPKPKAKPKDILKPKTQDDKPPLVTDANAPVPPKDAAPVKADDTLDKIPVDLAIPGEKPQSLSWTPLKKVLEKGNLFVEIGWKGFGPQLPPLNAGGFGVFRMKKIVEKKEYLKISEDPNHLLDDEILMDINDPRNNEAVEKIKEVRNNYLRSLLRNDMRMPLHDIESLRHEVIKIRYLDKVKDEKEHIPLLESEVAKNEKYRDLLVKHYQETNRMVRERGGNPDEPILMDRITKVEAPPRSEKTTERIFNTKMSMLKRQNVIKLQKNQGISDCIAMDQVIKEFRFVDAENAFMIALKELLQPVRRLKKKVKAAKKVAASAISEIVVSVQVIKGTHIPARTMNLVVDKPFSNNTDERAAGRDIAQRNKSDMNRPIIPEARTAVEKVQRAGLAADENTLIRSSTYDLPSTFVKVEIAGRNAQQFKETDIFDGIDPEWNENLKMAYKNENSGSFTNAELIKNKDTIYISVFDNLGSFQNRKDNPQLFNMQIEKRYLGGIKIPLHALFTNDKISSIFKIDRPIFLSGYMTTRNEIYSEPSAQGQENFLNPFIPSYIMLTMTCSPRLALPPVNLTEYFPGFESTEFLIKGREFLEEHLNNDKNRKKYIKIWGENTRGQSVFISKYLEPQRPPPDFEIDEDSYQKCARFVSLIPFTKDIGFFEDLPNMFTTSQEMIDLLAGDHEEHAVLLANYFNFIDRHLNKTQFESVLVLGQGVPSGNTIYVLRRDKVKDKSELWNPANAEVYSFDEIQLQSKFFCFNLSAGVTHEASSMDSICPLKEVDAIVTSENVYVNIQKERSVSKNKWDYKNNKLYEPFLT